MGKVLSAFSNGIAGAIARSIDDVVITEALTAALPEDTGADGNAVAPDPQ